MKTETFKNMKKAVEVLSAFGDAKSATQLKKYMHLSSVINKVEETTQKQIVDKVLNTYRPLFNELPKDIKGTAKKAFCAACNEVISNSGTLFIFDMNGNVVPNRVLRSIKKSDNTELFTLLGNLFSQAAALDEAQAKAQAKADNDKLDAYLSAMNDELAEYSVSQILAA